jgi:ribonuclease-3 family protein
MDMLSLAFLGDAVHTLFIREYVTRNYNVKMDEANKIASKFCRASHQAKVLELISPTLTEDEKEIVRKTRNIKNKHKAKNTDTMTYKFASCYEALIGYHYLQNNKERLDFLLKSGLEGEI